jgi:hypothetical protein
MSWRVGASFSEYSLATWLKVLLAPTRADGTLHQALEDFRPVSLNQKPKFTGANFGHRKY